MRLEIESKDRTVTVRLSRRNLLAFLGMLQGSDDPVIVNNDCWFDRRLTPGLLLCVIAEPDELHYARRPNPAGQMPDATEAFIHEAEHNPDILNPPQPKPDGGPERD